MPRCDEQGKAFKVPHVGWNTIEMPACNGGAAVPPCGKGGGNAVLSSGGVGGGAARSSAAKRGLFEHGAFPDSTPQPGSDLAFACPLFDGIAPGEYFYFTHSYIAPTGSHTIAETTHSVRFTSAVQYGDRAFGVQFHPEKSSDAGARVLANFVAIAARG